MSEPVVAEMLIIGNEILTGDIQLLTWVRLHL